MITCVTRARGNLKLPYVVTHINRETMRIVHVESLPQARLVESEWRHSDFSLTPGQVRPFNVREAA